MDIDQIIAIFPDLTNPDIEEIKVFATKKQCESGELIFSEGDEARSFYIIEKGHVSVTFDDNGKETLLCTLIDNDYFGEMAIYNHDKRCATVTAVEDTSLLEIEKQVFLDFVESHPEFK